MAIRLLKSACRHKRIVAACLAALLKRTSGPSTRRTAPYSSAATARGERPLADVPGKGQSPCANKASGRMPPHAARDQVASAPGKIFTRGLHVAASRHPLRRSFGLSYQAEN